MPTYKLMYYEGKGRAEVIRMALTVAGQEFEDKRFGRSGQQLNPVGGLFPVILEFVFV